MTWSGADRVWPSRRSSQRGQAAVELALCLPVILVLLLAVVQVGILVVDRVAVAQAAREAARRAAVDPDPGAVRQAALGGGLVPDRLQVLVGPRPPPGGLVEVSVRYRAATDVPLIGPMMASVELEAHAAMAVEVDEARQSGR